MPIQSTYDMVGIKEDISDVISNITPTDTPFLSMLKKGKCNNTFFQWFEDTLRPAAANARAEGFTASSNTPTTPATRSNYTQIMSETTEVSGTTEAVATYGRANELAYQVAKIGKSLKRDLEFALVGTQQASAAGNDSPDGAGTARQFAGYQAQVTTGASGNRYDQEDNDFNAPSLAAAPAGDAALTEAAILALNQRLYENGSEATTILLKPSDSLVFANFAYRTAAGVATTNMGIANVRGREMGDSTTIVNVVDFYKSPFGTQRVVIDRHIYRSDVLIFDPSYLEVVWLRPWFRETLAKTGDKTSVMVVGEVSYKNRNFLSGGYIANVA
jgi:hypothetical protein